MGGRVPFVEPAHLPPHPSIAALCTLCTIRTIRRTCVSAYNFAPCIHVPTRIHFQVRCILTDNAPSESATNKANAAEAKGMKAENEAMKSRTETLAAEAPVPFRRLGL